MLRYILIAISALFLFSAKGQDTLSNRDLGEIVCFSIDSKGNFFVSDDEFTLYKLDPKGKIITQVNIKTYGEIYSIDCSNPFELYVYHKNSNIVVFYDNMLNVRGELRLNNYLYTNVSCVARSFDNNVWIMDLTQYKLLKINKKGEVLAESPFLNNVLDAELNTYKIWEMNNEVLVADSLIGVYQFDIYATHSKTYQMPNNTNCTGNGTFLFFNTEKGVTAYHRLLRDQNSISISVPSNSDLVLHSSKLYYSSGHNLISFPLE